MQRKGYKPFLMRRISNRFHRWNELVVSLLPTRVLVWGLNDGERCRLAGSHITYSDTDGSWPLRDCLMGHSCRTENVERLLSALEGVLSDLPLASACSG